MTQGDWIVNKYSKGKTNTNKLVLNLLEERLDIGQKEYGQDIPLTGEKGRDNLIESLYEVLDSCVYIATEIITILEKRSEWQEKE